MSILQNDQFSNNIGKNIVPTPSGPAGNLNPGITNVPNSIANQNNYLPNARTNNGMVANKPVNANFLPNNIVTGNAMAKEITSNMFPNEQIISNAVPATITSANFVPIANMPTEVLNNLPMSPVISEIIPSLQYGDITMSGDLPIGGTIKVCGCFPVYGMINVDGSLPSTGTAVVAESFGNHLSEVVSQYTNQNVV